MPEASLINYSYRWCDWAKDKSKTQYPRGEHFNYSTMDTSVLGREFYGAGMNATLRDYGRFGLMMLNGGKSGDWVKVSTAATDNVGPVTPDGRLGYGYQWWTIANSEAYAAQGLFQPVYLHRSEEQNGHREARCAGRSARLRA